MCLLIAGLPTLWLLIDFSSDQKLDGGKAMVYSYTSKGVIAERLSARQLIVQRSQFAFVCMYVCMYVYPSHLRGRGFCGLVPRLLATWYWSDQEAIGRSCACESCNGAMAIRYWSEQEAIDVCKRSCESQNGARAVQA